MKKRVTQVEYEITLADGKNYAVRPLSLAEIKDAESLLETIQGLDDNVDVSNVPGLMDKLVDVCFFILKRCNKGATKEDIANAVGVNDIETLMNIAFSGKIPESAEVEEI